MAAAAITCVQCGDTFRNRQGLVVHSLIHTNELPFQCLVEGCNDRFRSFTARSRHIKTRHTHPTVKKPCPDCGQMLRPLSLSAHQRLKHLDEHPELKSLPKYQCPQCPMSFPLRGNLRRHMKRHAADRIVYGCRICPTTRLSEKAAMNHMVKCAKKFGVEVPSEGPIKRHKNAAVPLRGGGTVKRVAKEAFQGDEATKEGMDLESCSRAAMSKRQRTSEIAVQRSLAEEEAKLAGGETGARVFRCPFHDGMTYDAPHKLALHRKQHARLQGKFMCRHCGVQPNLIAVEFLTANKLRHHMRQFHADLIRAHGKAIADGTDVIDLPCAAGCPSEMC